MLLGPPPGLTAISTPIRAIFFKVKTCNQSAISDNNLLRNVLFENPQGLQAYWTLLAHGNAFFDDSTSEVVTVTIPCSQDCTADRSLTYVRDNAATIFGDASHLDQYQYQVGIGWHGM